MFKTACCLLLICSLLIGCNSTQKQTDPVLEKEPAPKPQPNPEPKPETITRVIELPLELAEEFAEEFSPEGFYAQVKVLEKFPHGAPKKLEVTGEQRSVEYFEAFALGKEEASDSFVIRKSMPEESSWLIVKELLAKGLITSATVSGSSDEKLVVLVSGTKLGIRKFHNALKNRVPALVPAKPLVIDKAISFLREGKKITRLTQKEGDPFLYVEGSLEAIAELNKLAIEPDK